MVSWYVDHVFSERLWNSPSRPFSYWYRLCFYIVHLKEKSCDVKLGVVQCHRSFWNGFDMRPLWKLQLFIFGAIWMQSASRNWQRPAVPNQCQLHIRGRGCTAQHFVNVLQRIYRDCGVFFAFRMARSLWVGGEQVLIQTGICFRFGEMRCKTGVSGRHEIELLYCELQVRTDSGT
jgi:hypothetical protein